MIEHTLSFFPTSATGKLDKIVFGQNRQPSWQTCADNISFLLKNNRPKVRLISKNSSWIFLLYWCKSVEQLWLSILDFKNKLSH